MVIGLSVADLGRMTLGEFQDAVEAYNAANADETKADLSPAEEDDLIAMMGIE
ncbi:hypothetical protein [Lichenihabitans psoromatis]|uniref:hypothetical protein n=1 Tax=Lichenihabitans psoromatis TaxID=2528642 RepID=UPI0013F148F3|nr:hypothetical protein [Lichenihabitans psoromatis]